MTPLFLLAQTPVVDWVRTYTPANSAHGVVMDQNGNVYVTGDVNGTGNDMDFLTLKYDSNGNLLWNKTFDSGISDVARGIAVDSNNNIYVVGASGPTSPYPFNYDYCTTATSNRIIKYDTNGNVLWNVTYNGRPGDLLNAITLDVNGNIYVAGATGVFPGWSFLTAKLDTNGNTLWSKAGSVNNNDAAWGITLDSKGNVIVTGYHQYHAIKYDPNGNVVWDKVFVPGTTWGYGITVDQSDNIYLNGFDWAILKCDPAGNILWKKNYISSPWGTGSQIAIGGVCSNAFTNVFAIGQQDFPGGDNIVILQYDLNGNQITNTLDNVPMVKTTPSIATDIKGNVVVAAGGETITGNCFLTIKYSYPTCTPIPTLTPTPVIVAPSVINASTFPNPLRSGNITFSISLSNDLVNTVNVRIFTISHREIANLKLNGTHFGQNSLSWNVKDFNGNSLANGLYYYLVEATVGTRHSTAWGKLAVLR